jgi:hypothetical protein
MTTTPQSMSDTQALLLAAKQCDGVADTVEGNKYCGAKTEHLASMDARIATLRNAAKVCRATAEQAGKVEECSGIAFDRWFERNGFPEKTRRMRSLAFEYGWRAANKAKPTQPAAQPVAPYGCKTCGRAFAEPMNAAPVLPEPERPYDNSGDDLGPWDQSKCVWPNCPCDQPSKRCGPEEE